MAVLGTAEVVIKGTGFKKVDKSIDSTRVKFANFAGVSEKSLKKVEDNLKSFAKKATLALGVTALVVTKMGADFEKQIAIVGGVARATESELKDLEKAAREAGATTEKTALQSAEALQFLAMAGFSAKDSIAALSGVINLSTAGNLDLATAADITTNVLTGMGLAVSDLSKVNDTLIATSTRTNTNVMQLGEAFKFVAPVAKAVNLSLEDTSAILGTLANAGVRASDAGTDLRQALIRTGKVAKQLGLGEGATLIDVLKKVKEEQWGVTEVTKAFGLIATKSVLILKDNIEQYEDLAVSIKGASGEAQELADKIRDTLSGQFATLVSALQESGLQVFDILKDDLKDIVVFLTEAVRGTSDLIKAFGELYNLRSVSDTFAEGIELISSGVLDMKVVEFQKLSFIERQKLVDRYEKDLLELRDGKEKEYSNLIKKQSEDRLKEYQSYLGRVGGLFDDEYNKIIKREQVFLKQFVENADLGLGNAFKDKSLVGQVSVALKAVAPTVGSETIIPASLFEEFDSLEDSLNDELRAREDLVKAIEKENRSRELRKDRFETGKEFSNMLDALIEKVITKPGAKGKKDDDFNLAVKAFEDAVFIYIDAAQALLELPSKILDAVTNLVETFADLPNTIGNSVTSLGNTVGGFLQGGFGFRGREEAKERRRVERERLAEIRTGLETEWNDIIAVFDLSPLEESLFNLNKKYAEQEILARQSGASILKLNEARALEISSITQAAIEASQSQFSGLFSGIEGFKRTAALGQSDNPFKFLLDEFVALDNQIENLVDSTDEQIRLQEMQVSTLSDLYSLAREDSVGLKASNEAVQSTIDSLTLMSIGTSFDAVESRYNELFNQALTSLDTADIQQFLTFTNDYMATLEAAGMDAETIRISTVADLEFLQGAIGDQLSVVEENTNAILSLTDAIESSAINTQFEDSFEIWEQGLSNAVTGITESFQQSIADTQANIDLFQVFLDKVAIDQEDVSFGETRLSELQLQLSNLLEQRESSIQATTQTFEADRPTETGTQISQGGQMVTVNLMLDPGQIAQSVVFEISNDGELTQVIQQAVQP